MTTVCKVQFGWELVSWVGWSSGLVGWVLIGWNDQVLGAWLAVQAEPLCWRNTWIFFCNESLTFTSTLLSSTISASQSALGQFVISWCGSFIFSQKQWTASCWHWQHQADWARRSTLPGADFWVVNIHFLLEIIWCFWNPLILPKNWLILKMTPRHPEKSWSNDIA